MKYDPTEEVLFDQQGGVLVATINRPDSLNSLTASVEQALVARLEAAEDDPSVGSVVISGVGRAFAAGADIGELQRKTTASMHAEQTFSGWDRFAEIRIPKIAAVGGYALGGGCELALMCDLIFAGESAQFGQPELRLGLIPGMGGTQRLTRMIGRAKAMDLILTSRMMDASEAERAGLVSRVVPDEELLDEAILAAETIAGFGRLSVGVARDCVLLASELAMSEGVREERQRYFSLFDSDDAKEGMAAFLDKRSRKR